MNYVARPPVVDLNHAARLKQLQLSFESAPPDLSTTTTTRVGLSPDLQPSSPPAAAAADQPVRRDPQPALRVGKYIILDQIEGSTLYKCIYTETQEEYVCKIVNNETSQQILTAHFRLDSHENINEIHEVLIGPRQTYIIFPCSYGDLYSYVRSHRRLREPVAQKLFQQIAAAVAHCHKNGVVLRDLKLRKFAFKDPERTQLKLESLEDAIVLDGVDDSLSYKHGCPAYVSPEMLMKNGQYSGCAADAWSLGVMLYTMVVGRYPFHDTEPAALFTKIWRAQLVVPEWLSSRARCLLRCLLRPNPNERLMVSDILAHPWLNPSPRELPAIRQDSHFFDQTVPDSPPVK